MSRIRQYLLSAMLLSFSILNYAQSATDTLQLARELSEKQDFKQAISLLEQYQNNHPKNVYASQLLANCLQWDKQYDRAGKKYYSAIIQHPDADFLVLDYARMKFEQKKHEEAEKLYTQYLAKNSNNVEARINLGYIAYWNGYFKVSEKYFSIVLDQYPENPTALKMISEIEKITKPYINIGFDYNSDSQPLNTTIPKIEIGRYHTHWFQPKVHFDYMLFSNDSGSKQIPWARISNQSSLNKNQTHINLTLGVAGTADKSGGAFSGQFEVSQKITSELSVSVKGESMPYYYSLASIYVPVSYNSFSVSANWVSLKSFTGQVAFDQHYFMDSNQISTFYIWGVSRAFGFEKVNFSIGYSYNYSTSKYNSFESFKAVDELVQDKTYDNIEGIYVPYFTPKNQNIHGVIGVVNLFSKNDLSFELKGNIGVYAFADIPYLYLDISEISSDIIIAKDYYVEHKTTLELSAKAKYSLSSNVVFDISYIYSENFFYTNNLVSFNLRYRFK